MVAYKFYLRNPKGDFELIGVLPERRRDPERISDESVFTWGEKYFGRNVKEYKDIFFVEAVSTDIEKDSTNLYAFKVFEKTTYQGGNAMPLIRKRRIWWEPVPEATSYVVYVSKDNTIFESAKFFWAATPGIFFKQVTGKTELIIPDEWPEFPPEQGTYYIGITSKDEAGNESDPFLSSGLFKFSAPSPPSKGGIESL